jgi:hypothetical protein
MSAAETLLTSPSTTTKEAAKITLLHNITFLLKQQLGLDSLSIRPKQQ